MCLAINHVDLYAKSNVGVSDGQRGVSPIQKTEHEARGKRTLFTSPYIQTVLFNDAQ
jgi:hypothetical protein